MKEYTYPEKNSADHVAEPVVEYETDTLIDEADVAPYLRVPMEELQRRVYRSYEGWLRGERTYSTEEIQRMMAERMAKDNPNS